MKEIEQQYIQSLSDKEKQAYEIAKANLGSLFTLTKTAGFLQWKQKQSSK
jgi:hypothetical protein